MIVVWAKAAQADLDEILAYTSENFPGSVDPLERRVRAVVARIVKWPESARLVYDRPGVRVVPLIRYPFRIYYRVARDRIEILHVHHTSRRPRAQ